MTTIRRLAFPVCITILLVQPGCGGKLRYYNTSAWIERQGDAYNDTLVERFMKNNYYYPIRDVFDPRVAASLFDPAQVRAWNIDAAGEVDDGSFYTNRPISTISPSKAAAGPGLAPPKSPWKVVTRRPETKNKLASFIGRDGTGRTFLVKLGDRDHPEANSAAAVITARVLYLLGYHVPANTVVTIAGTGVCEFDGRRAEASLFIDDNVLGFFKFDKLRYRREMRALRLVAAWLDDLDRCAGNTLAVFRSGRTWYYLIDFDSSLGLWQGRPKQPWRGYRYAWDPNWSACNLMTLGGMERQMIKHDKPFSAAVGIFYADDFDPLAWKQCQPNSAFRFMTREDAKWMAGKIARITPQQILAIVKAARYSGARDERHVYDMLMARREKILLLLDDTPRSAGGTVK